MENDHFHLAYFGGDVGNGSHESEPGSDRGVGGKHRRKVDILLALQGMEIAPVHEPDSLHLTLQHLRGEGHITGDIDRPEPSHDNEDRSRKGKGHHGGSHHDLHDGEGLSAFTASSGREVEHSSTIEANLDSR